MYVGRLQTARVEGMMHIGETEEWENWRKKKKKKKTNKLSFS